MTLLEFKRNATKSSNETLDMWIGYCAFHSGKILLMLYVSF